jgi:hypothetical protein
MIVELVRGSERNLFIDVAGNDPLQDPPHTETRWKSQGAADSRYLGVFVRGRDGMVDDMKYVSSGRRSRDRLHYYSQLRPGAVPVN